MVHETPWGDNLWLLVSVWINGSVVYTLLSATDRRWEIGSAWGSLICIGKNSLITDTWEISGLIFILFYFIFEERDIVTCRWVYNFFLLLLLRTITKFLFQEKESTSSVSPSLLSFFPLSLLSSHPLLLSSVSLMLCVNFHHFQNTLNSFLAVGLSPYDLRITKSFWRPHTPHNDAQCPVLQPMCPININNIVNDLYNFLKHSD